RFRRAAEAALPIYHPHIIPTYRSGATASFLWFSTKHVEGRSISEIVRTSGPMDLAHCLRTLEQVASALDYAHRRGVVHGALSSSNVVLDANEWALVGDFAVAEVVVSARAAAEAFNARGPGSPVVIMDDEPEPHRGGRRLAAAAGLVLALGAGGVWLTLSSLPAAAPLDRRMGRPSETATVSAPLPPPPPPAPPPSTDPA